MVSGSADVAKTQPFIRPDQYKEVKSFDDALALLQETGQELISAEEAGDGFEVADKATLCGVPMLCLNVMIRDGDLGGYAVVRAVTKDNRKIAFADGSTGLYAQLLNWQTDHGDDTWPTLWKHGLRRSDYEAHQNKAGDSVPAGTTYYLDTSA